uniref:Uncharacterized protein n=1 Tax=Myoviridae sp. ctx322 TaxID=2826711 RepID=A0A8S5NA53_9CAUD|nr:MAG TPA: hypothetical protein [Myoviridae sp. ctx322]
MLRGSIKITSLLSLLRVGYFYGPFYCSRCLSS